MSKFFSNLPNVYVGVEGADEIISYKKVKNIFRRAIMRQDIFDSITSFDYYDI